MAVRRHRPNEGDLAALLSTCRDDGLSYAPTGASLTDETVPGLERREWTIGLPDDAFDRAAEALRSWAVHRGAGLVIATDGPIAIGTNVALNAPLPLGWVDATCRLVLVVDEPDQFGFAYGTLSVHPESGEEAFLVVRDDQGVRFDVRAVSRPSNPLARLVPYVAHRLQDAAVRRYLSAMTRAAGGLG